MSATIRPETAADFASIFEVNRRAFAGDAESRLVDALRSAGASRISLVAEIAGRVVGHVLFSDLAIVNQGRPIAALALAPLAVLPQHQRQGLGSALVREGLEVARRAGHRIVIVVGHPAYYPRFGFSAELARRLESPYSGPSCMALELVAGALAGVTGKLEYPPAFAAF
jgi:putative acetyltransferase